MCLHPACIPSLISAVMEDTLTVSFWSRCSKAKCSNPPHALDRKEQQKAKVSTRPWRGGSASSWRIETTAVVKRDCARMRLVGDVHAVGYQIRLRSIGSAIRTEYNRLSVQLCLNRLSPLLCNPLISFPCRRTARSLF